MHQIQWWNRDGTIHFYSICSVFFRTKIVDAYTTQWCVLTNSSPLGVGQAPVENSWGTYKTKNVAHKKFA